MGLIKKPIILSTTLYLLVVSTLSLAENAAISSQDEPSREVNGFFKKTQTVEIINDLGDGSRLTYHCKSKDDDLGVRSLPPGGSWSFNFASNLFLSTRFYCYFSWSGLNGHWFDIYIDKRDNIKGKNRCSRCTWKIRKNGPCRFNNKTNNFDICYGWNK